MRWSVAVALGAALGIIAGFLLPVSKSSAGTGYWHEAAIAPPARFQGNKALLTCGWHTGACDQRYEDGPALDWDDTDTLWVFFRGWFTRSNSPYEWSRLWADPYQWKEGPGTCDEMVVDVYESYSGRRRFGMHYLHAYTMVWWDFSIYTQDPPRWNDFGVAVMIQDAGCPGQWYHVHDYIAYVRVQYTARNGPGNPPAIPKGDYCMYDWDPSDCFPYWNNATWTRWAKWEEGY